MGAENPKYHSDIAFYHNQKDGSVEEGGAMRTVNNEKYRQWILAEEKRKKAREFMGTPKLIEAVKTTIDKIKEAELEELFKGEPEQLAELIKAKELSLKMIKELLYQSKRYWDAVGAHDLLKNRQEEMNQADYDSELENAEQVRSLAHNALLDQVRIAIRFISHTFGKIDERAQEKWEEERTAAGKPVLMVKRTNFPKNILLPDNIDLNERKQIAAWSHLIIEELSRIEEYLNHE